LLNATDKIVSVDSVEADGDGTAMEMAGQLIVSKHAEFAAIEVWDHARCVGKVLSPTDKPNLDSILKIS
jgi:hypothetical protein